ncbi:AraC-like ligand binding domain-containing protein [Pricia antarctica]|uniref:AraC-like ligand binding domain-containing protein n=1 Tax=Pricia antarctica TaxID=641691 RepID=A0A1G7DEP2_9FLAO|nr:helix-turn-helix transcriptional regulator [Pricia antarctica]SDE49500.1 AraC-like ligand binding domain-containing protein [Pricia antarctica]
MKNQIETYTKITPTADIKIEPFDVNKRYTRPHRHTKYLELVYFRKGSGFHYMDQQSYAIEPPIIFLIKKDEVHHWKIDTVPEGFVILIKQDFLDSTLDKNINLQLQQLSFQQKIEIQTDVTIDSLFEILCNEMEGKRAGLNEVVEGALKALLAKIIGYANMEGTSNMGDTLSRFDGLLGKELKNKVSHYAALLNTTAQNLNSLCKGRYSKTASQVIAVQMVKEAKRLLRFTDLSVTEIAYKFAFKDVSHFVKYYKRYEGETPMQFKKRQ